MFFSVLVSQLSSTAPQFEDSELHKLRHAVLEVLAKLPPNDKLQPYLNQLMQVCVSVCVDTREAEAWEAAEETDTSSHVCVTRCLRPSL